MADAAGIYWAEAGCGLAEVTHAVRGLGIRVVRWYPDKNQLISALLCSLYELVLRDDPAVNAGLHHSHSRFHGHA